MSDQTSREQQAEIATQAINRMEDLIAGLPEPAPFYKAFAEATDEILKAAALRAPVRPQEKEDEKDSGAGLIHQAIPDVDDTEPRLTIPPIEGPCPMAAPTFDESGDYPSDETLHAIENWPAMRINELFEFVLAAWHWPDWASTELRPSECEMVNAEEGDLFLRLATGGWSGNESIVQALDCNLWARQQWCLSRRGGLHIYEFKQVGSVSVSSTAERADERAGAQAPSSTLDAAPPASSPETPE